MKKALIVANMLFASATVFYANADAPFVKRSILDGWRVVSVPNAGDAELDDWEIIDVPNADESDVDISDWEIIDGPNADESDVDISDWVIIDGPNARDDVPNADESDVDISDWVIIDGPNADEPKVDVSDWVFTNALHFTGSDEKEVRKQYNPRKMAYIPSLTLEDELETHAVFFHDIDNEIKNLTITDWASSGSYPTAVESIASDQQAQSFVKALYDSCDKAYDENREFANQYSENVRKLIESGEAIPFYANNEYMGLVRQVGDKLIVSLPGTRFGSKEGLMDAWKDLRFAGYNGGYSSSKGTPTHAAFSKDVMDAFNAMVEAIKNKSSNVSEIWFTGHSKGGGEAILSAYKFAEYVKTQIQDEDVLSKFRNENRIRVFTFSAPGVVKPQERDRLYNYISKQNIICVHKKPDMVPKITDYVGFVPVGVRMKMAKTKTARLLDYYKGLTSAHFLTGFTQHEYDNIVKMAKYTKAKFSPTLFFDARESNEDEEVFFDAQESNEDEEVFFDAQESNEDVAPADEQVQEQSTKGNSIVKNALNAFNRFLTRRVRI